MSGIVCCVGVRAGVTLVDTMDGCPTGAYTCESRPKVLVMSSDRGAQGDEVVGEGF